MSRRFFSSIMILLLPVGLVVLLALVATQWGNHNSDAAGKQGPKAPNGVWSSIATFPAVVVSPTPGTNPLKIKRAAAVAYPPNGKIYLLGGRHGVDGEDVALHWIWEYAPGANTWTQKVAQLDPGSQGSVFAQNMATGVLTNANGVRIYAVGGSSIDAVETPVTRVYDPVADTLTTDDAWPASPNRVAGGYAVYNNKLYLFGGFSYPANGGTGGVFTDTWKFDPSQPSGSRWSQVPTANLLLGRAFIASAVVDGKLYAVGGDTWNPSTQQLVPVTNVEMLDLTQANPTWVARAPLPSARGDMGAWGYDSNSTYELAGKVMVAGGHYDVPDSTGYLYNTSTNSWTNAPNMVYATRDYGYTQLNGILYALGGYDYSASTPNGANFNQSYDGSTGGATNTPTVTGTPPTATRTTTIGPATNTRTATATPSPGPCGDLIVNGGFETGTLAPWTVLGTNPAPVVSNALPHTGTYSALLGTVSGTEPNGDGSMYQTITVPASGGTLSYWWNGGTTDTITFDWQDAYVTNTSGTILATIQHTCTTTSGWQNQTFNMAPYAGQTIRIEFLVHQDGFGDDTYMYVDDVTLGSACPTGSPTVVANTPTRTSTIQATNTATRTSTNTPTNTPSNTPTNTPTGTTQATNTPTNTPSHTPVATNTPTSPAVTTETPTTAPTSTACPIQFTDVPNGSTFYPYIRCLACRGIVNGYSDGTFRPDNNVTRGQLSKMVSNSAGFNDPQTVQMFQDVPPGSTFFNYIGRLASRGYINGYDCGGPGEPCVAPANLPYFRTNNNATRGQITKIVSNAAGFNDPPTGQTFEDVPPGSTFYTYTERLATRGVMQGYQCGGSGEPCVPPGNLPYFRTFNNATRGQTSKIVANTFFPNCDTPIR